VSGGQDGGPAGPELEPLGPEGEQGSLFAEEVFGDGPPSGDVVGYRGPAACQIVGITYRQLDYWARTKLVVPSIRSATGSGSQRLYSFKDLAVLKVVKNLLDTGVSTSRASPCSPTGSPSTSAPPRRRSSTCCRAARASSGSPWAVPCGRSPAASRASPPSGPTPPSSTRRRRTSWPRAATVEPAPPADTHRVTRATRTLGPTARLRYPHPVVLGHRAGETCTQKPLAAGAEGATPPRNLSGIPDRAEETTSGKR
jgi:hypothetical protein